MPSYMKSKARSFCPSQFTFLGTTIANIFVLESIANGFICPAMICDFLISQRKGHIPQGNKFFIMWMVCG
jgi:hypothetical protein